MTKDKVCQKASNNLNINKALVGYIVVLSFIINILFLVVPMYSMQVFDRVLSSQSIDTLWMLCGIALFLIAIQALIEWSRSRLMFKYGSLYERRHAPLMFESSLESSQVGKGTNAGSLADLDVVKKMLCNGGLFPLVDAMFMPLFVVVMYLMHPYLGHFTVIGCVLFVFISLTSFALGVLQTVSSGALTNSFIKLSGDWLRNSVIARAHGMVSRLSANWEKESNNQIIGVLIYENKVKTIQSVSKWLRMVLQLGVLTISVVLVLDNQVSAGVLIAASMIMGRALAPLEQSVMLWKPWQEAREAYKRLKSVKLKSEAVIVDLPKIEGVITFDHVSLMHPHAENPFISELTFTIPPGKSMAIIGPSGAGKTSILSALLGLHAIEDGEIRIDGATTEQWSVDALGEQIGFVSQNTALLSGSIAQNISRFDSAPDSKRIVESSRLAGVHEMILSLPQGYQTLVGDVGIQLSGGQIQRIAIARALYSDPTVLILDEPDAHMDRMGQIELIRLIGHCRSKKKTLIVVSHRYQIIEQTDLSLVIEAGKQRKFGATVSLLSQGGNANQVGSSL